VSSHQTSCDWKEKSVKSNRPQGAWASAIIYILETALEMDSIPIYFSNFPTGYDRQKCLGSFITLVNNFTSFLYYF
jgi:hypothetical protein